MGAINDEESRSMSRNRQYGYLDTQRNNELAQIRLSMKYTGYRNTGAAVTQTNGVFGGTQRYASRRR